MDKDLAKFNAMVRKWADQQPARYRKSALAFGYRCDKETHSFSGTLDWVSRQSRKRKGEGVSRATLVRHLAVFKASGVITVERRRDGDKNVSSVYHVNFDRLIGTGDPERDAYLVSLTIPDKPVMPSECYGHDIFKCGCEHCDGYLEAHREWRMAC